MLERVVAAAGYFFAAVGLVLCVGLGVAAVLQPDFFGYFLGWATDAGLTGVLAIVAAVLIVGVGVAVARRLAKRGSL